MTATIEEHTESAEADSDGEPPRAFQAQSYAALLKFPDIAVTARGVPPGTRGATAPAVDAIVVPTIRSAEQLTAAVDLASNAGCKLLALYTDDFPAGLSPVLGRLGRNAALLALPRDLEHDLLDLAAGVRNAPVSACALDISRKRNLGLLIGRLCGWSRMIFLDDDIRRLNTEKLGLAAALLDRYPVVGMQVKKFPDASVVGHARRLAGRRQEPFISGGSMLVDPQRLNGFFPPVYHEDWLCILNHLRRREVAVGGEVGQLPYRPFTTTERAELEEFGDIFASGLLGFVHARRRRGNAAGLADRDDRDYWHAATEPLFWKEILSERANVLEDLVASLKTKKLNLPDPSPLPSVEAARKRCYDLTPEEFVDFTVRWLETLGQWRERLSGLPRVDSVGKALARLGLSHAVRLYGEPARQDAARGTRWTGGFMGQWGRRAPADGRPRFGLRGLFLASGSWPGPWTRSCRRRRRSGRPCPGPTGWW